MDNVSCVECGFSSVDSYTIEVWNSITGKCPMCGAIGGLFEIGREG